MWYYKDGKKIFAGNSEDYALAVNAAIDCGEYIEDTEDEIVTADRVSCFNCRYRRWLSEGFCCMKYRG